MYRKFPSLTGTKYAYAYDSEQWKHDAPFGFGRFVVFDTYGDGMIQHSGAWQVNTEQITDFLASMAAILLADDELIKEVYHHFLRKPTREQIEFAASVVYKEPDEKRSNRRWYSVEQLKVSSSDSKRHDKRYSEVTSIHDGSANSIYRILLPEYADSFTRYSYANAIREWGYEVQRQHFYMEIPGIFLNWFKDEDVHVSNEKARHLRDAFDACVCAIEGYQKRDLAQRHIENYKRACTPKPEPEEVQS